MPTTALDLDCPLLSATVSASLWLPQNGHQFPLFSVQSLKSAGENSYMGL